MAQTSLTPRSTRFNSKTAIDAANNRETKGRGPSEPFINLRRQHVIEMRVRGVSTADIAKHFNVSETTIHRDVACIRRDGLVEKYEARFLGRLMPLALEKLVKQLKKDDDNLDGVKEVFKRFDRLSEQKHQRELVEGVQQEETLSGWYEQYLANKTASEAPPANAVDTELVEETDAADHDYTAVSQAGASPSGDAGPADAGGPSPEASEAPVSPDASQSGLETSPEGREGPGGDDSAGTRA